MQGQVTARANRGKTWAKVYMDRGSAGTGAGADERRELNHGQPGPDQSWKCPGRNMLGPVDGRDYDRTRVRVRWVMPAACPG